MDWGLAAAGDKTSADFSEAKTRMRKIARLLHNVIGSEARKRGQFEKCIRWPELIIGLARRKFLR
jgi:hypothetical protein